MNYTLVISLALLLLMVIHLCIYLHRERSRMDHQLMVEFANWKQQQVHLSGELKNEIADNRREISGQMRNSRNDLDDRLAKFSQHQIEIFDLLNRQVKDLVDSNESRFKVLHTDTTQSLEKIRLQVSERLDLIRLDNQQQLEKMRATVDEKLHQTLEERLGRSFKLVSDHLEKVQKGLGEMQSLAAGVGDLKKVLSNVKTRGILGEIQLLNIIEEIMTPDQYELNANIVPGRDGRVEVAIKLPGNKEKKAHLYLPIDSKFPMDKYQVLSDAYDGGCSVEIGKCSKELRKAILTAAKDIRSKYVAPPYTTDFAIMFLPVEGLYAEISRQGDLLHTLRSDYQILVAGPSNLSAFLSSLQMGFRTLAIEKRSSEVWTILGTIKTEFGKFGTALEKVQKKLSEANSAIDQAGVRRRVLERKLNKVEELPVPTLPLKSVL